MRHTTPGAAGQNKQHSITKNTAKLDRETEELHHDRVTLEVGKVIQQGRQSKGLTQKDLATVSGTGPLRPGRGRQDGDQDSESSAVWFSRLSLPHWHPEGPWEGRHGRSAITALKCV